MTMAEVRICRWKHDAPFAYSMTYDEGTVDTLENALPIHEAFGFPGHVDVVAGQLGRARDAWLSSMNGHVHMGPDELRTLIGHGWGVGNHSWSHAVYPCQPGVNLYREVVWSKYRLEDAIARPVRVFTIPNDTFNHAPMLPLVREHYLACVNVEGGLNRDGFDLYNIGNNLFAADGPKPRPGWPDALRTPNLAAHGLAGAWLLDTTHLCMPDVPQPHKCITPEALRARFERLRDLSQGALWAATPDDVIDYTLLRRRLTITNVCEEAGAVHFDVGGEWPAGVVNPVVTLRVSGAAFGGRPEVAQQFHESAGGYAGHRAVESVKPDGADWLVTMALAPRRTVTLRAS